MCQEFNHGHIIIMSLPMFDSYWAPFDYITQKTIMHLFYAGRVLVDFS